MDIHADKEYWTRLKWPAAPNETDFAVFESYCKGRVLLLGSTQLLLLLADEAWDLEPVYDNPKIKVKDWFNLNEHWDTIIVDGALAFGMEFTHQLLPIVPVYTEKNIAPCGKCDTCVKLREQGIRRP